MKDESLEYQKTREIIWRVLLLVLLLVTFTLLGIVVYLSIKTEDDNGVCLKPACVRAATHVLDSMNFNVNPCDNFYEFACGNWMASHIIPEDTTWVATFTLNREKIKGIVKGLLEKNITEDDIEAVVKAKQLYQSCMNEDLIEKRNITVLNPLIKEMGGLPLLGQTPEGGWSRDGYNLNKLLSALATYTNYPLANVYVYGDYKEPNKSVIYFEQASFFLPSRDYYIKKEHKELIQEFKNILVKFVVLIGADPKRAKADIDDLIEFETELAKIHIKREDRIDNEARYNVYKLGELNDTFGVSSKHGFSLSGYIRNSFMMEGVEIKLDDNDTVIVEDVNFTKKLIPLLDRFTPRTIANYVIMRFMRYRMYYLPKRFGDLLTEISKLTGGKLAAQPRWKKCSRLVMDYLGLAVGRLFVKDNFIPAAKSGMSNMIRYIKDSFNDLLTDLDWMDKDTVKVAKEKVEAMDENIGYDTDILDDNKLNRRYENITLDPDTYFENILGMLKVTAIRGHISLRKNIHKFSWETAPFVVNAFYSPTTNKIMFPAGILQQPHFHVDQPWSLNFGGIGTLVGHEITHGFDNSGRQFDKEGRLIQWWKDGVIQKFEAKSKCLVEQYGNFKLPEADYHPVNGITTLGENIADNGGLKQAFRGYQKWLNDNGGTEKLLPGVNLSHQQLFFLAYAQVRCANLRKKDAKNMLLTGRHSPSRFRVIGALQNSKEFSEVYQCPVGSYMNPVKKCYVW